MTLAEANAEMRRYLREQGWVLKGWQFGYDRHRQEAWLRLDFPGEAHRSLCFETTDWSTMALAELQEALALARNPDFAATLWRRVVLDDPSIDQDVLRFERGREERR